MTWDQVGVVARMILALVFSISGTYKLLTRRPIDGLALAFPELSPVTRMPAMMVAIGIVEIGAATVAATGAGGTLGGASLTAFILLLTLVLWRIYRAAPSADCGCLPPLALGQSSMPWRRRFVRNGVLLVAGVLLLIAEALHGRG